MQSLRSYINEKYDLNNHPKKKWIIQKLSDIDDKIMEYIFEQYKTVYSNAGMDLSAFTPKELRDGYEIVMLIDVDKDPMPDAFIFTRKKMVKLLATDEQKASKKAMVKKLIAMIKSDGFMIEASKKIDTIMKDVSAPIVLDKKKIEKMLGSKFIKHLDDGYYERKLKNAGPVVKRMYGK